MTITEYISTHPKVALIVGVSHVTVAEVLKGWEIPVIIMQAFQVGAWSVTIIVGCITTYGAAKRAYLKWKLKNLQ